MWSKDRHQRILSMLEVSGRVSAMDLVSILGVSRETVRRDLVDLELAGLVQRVHGGVVLPDTSVEAPFEKRRQSQTRAKRDIARKAVSLIKPGASLFVDAGSTTSIFAQELVKLSGIMVVTNSIEIATTVQAANAGINLVLLGGRLVNDVPGTYGELTVSEIRRFQVDMAFIAPVGLHAEKGAFSYELLEADVAGAMIENAAETVLLVDHTKQATLSRVRFCEIGQIGTLVADNSSTPAQLEPFRRAGIKVVI
ncbi:MAG: DeoR/GlpR family DNA-binding transcription regulator [Pseudodonghicola sp.]|nr:DeoR/GlpR family DNA-binding transcription regulator [Pseudodonghicola sp.]